MAWIDIDQRNAARAAGGFDIVLVSSSSTVRDLGLFNSGDEGKIAEKCIVAGQSTFDDCFSPISSVKFIEEEIEVRVQNTEHPHTHSSRELTRFWRLEIAL